MGLRAKQAVALAAGVVLAIVMVLLGLWQQASYEESTRDVSAERAAMEPVSLLDNIAEDGSIEDIYGRRVQVSGVYEELPTLFVGSEPPLRVVGALRTTDDRVLAVVRGASDLPDAPPPPSGQQDITGIFLAPDLATDRVADGADLGSLRIQALAQDWPSPLIAGYVTLSADDAAAQGLEPAPLLLPEAEGSATHRGYALQWWVFAAGAIAFGVYAARGLEQDEKKRQRRAAETHPTP
ncbi:SURF1 family protein [Tessaracoccus flavus]|uniref:SURF1-like protein n=1 Tax=Tessaracoccus flavus TaxID=1610493 RepID=A0A1Q2CHW2_9ACTN|nr:SURF1 family protein [Tessaracoccus flavus]AQP45709.1 hypothetical protein RPIT_13555 [Tessaracoccus flavus]SDZ13174.1 Cytochrome oxidase assembly protein ShyY1 [Tessaracoccus flavus]